MSLKAKLEAVIYAAEEPVTLTQLAVLFTADALEWKAEQETAAAEAMAAAESSDPESQPLLDSTLESLGLEQTPDLYASAEANSSEPAGEPAAESTSAEGPPAESEIPAPDPEAEAKRQARQRDREIKAILRKILDELIADYATDGRGVEIREIAGGYRMATKPECHDAVRLFIKSLKPPMKLSLPALETLAVIAYKQPVTAPEVNEIRGVDSSGVFGLLLSRKLITTAGRKQVIGRPILYKTTKEFLLRFGLKDVTELPSMEEFEKIAAVELSESGDESEDVGGPGPEGGPELDENASEEEGTPTGELASAQPSEPPAEPASVGSQAETEHSPHD
ncbi:MAG TPA: SMC-Scp complex subunit ScpB [Terracidiphilus sp.]|jgi:segregation and condensation protein B|nr:SMC-Scp complex subunit ScpB [Terracidiphilus sp.]